MKKHFYSIRVVDEWNEPSGEIANAESTKVFKKLYERKERSPMSSKIPPRMDVKLITHTHRSKSNNNG